LLDAFIRSPEQTACINWEQETRPIFATKGGFFTGTSLFRADAVNTLVTILALW
jgi:hypothetical protein